MVLTRTQLEERGYNLTRTNNLAAIELKRFYQDNEERGLKLGLELLAKIKVYQKLTCFLDKTGSKKWLNSGPLYPVLQFILGDSCKSSLDDGEIEAFFTVERDFYELDGHLNGLLNQNTWDFGHGVHAAVLGLSLRTLNFLEYTADRQMALNFERFESLCTDFLSGSLEFPEFIRHAKQVLEEIQKGIDHLLAGV